MTIKFNFKYCYSQNCLNFFGEEDVILSRLSSFRAKNILGAPWAPLFFKVSVDSNYPRVGQFGSVKMFLKNKGLKNKGLKNKGLK